jgi:hypothetical protein
MEDTQQTDFLVKDETLIPYQDLVVMVQGFRDQLQSLDYRVTNKNFGSKFYQTKEHINSKAKLSAGSKDEIVVMDGQHPLYRFWVGAEDPFSAPFTIDKDGNAVMNSVTLTGYIPAGGALDDIGPDGITGTYIDDGAITTPKLSATAINGMTITGALIRTSSSGGRVVLDDSTDSLEVYDTSGNLRILLDNDELTFINSAGATRGGLIANTTELFLYALNGGNLQIEAEGSAYVVLFSIAGTQKGYFSTSGLTLNDDLNMDGNDIIGIDEIVFDKRTSTPNRDGEMLHYDDGSAQSMRVQMDSIDYTFDLSFL